MRDRWIEDRPHAREEGSLYDQFDLFLADAKVEPSLKRNLRDKQITLALSVRTKNYTFAGDGWELIVDTSCLAIDDIGTRHYEPRVSSTQTFSDQNGKAATDFLTHAHRVHPWGATYVNVGGLPEIERWCQKKGWTRIPEPNFPDIAEGYYQFRMDNRGEQRPILLVSSRWIAQNMLRGRRGPRQIGPK